MKINTAIKEINLRRTISLVIFDIFALAIIYLIPTFSHMLNVPLYFAEPMRIMIIISMVYAHKKNAYALALSLPLFSFLIAAHPVLFKSLLISIELVFMVWLFYNLSKYLNNFTSIITSIVASKLLYYGLKIGAIYTILPNESLIGIPLYIQMINVFVFSVLFFGLIQLKNKE